MCWRSHIPYAVVINSAYFTTDEHKGDKADPGMKVVPNFNIFQSLTFAIMLDNARDKGLLEWMNIQLPGSQQMYSMSRKTFYICQCAGAMAQPAACLTQLRAVRQTVAAIRTLCPAVGSFSSTAAADWAII